ncbi:MAG: hypothetical protein P9L88_07505 [Candidatus Tantalella remota]|nr:hypothetical protein [Candidatus Tantalella remota]
MKKTLLILVIFAMVCIAALAAVMQKEIVAEGMASGITTESRKMAVNRALRKAVEQGVGVIIDSETMVKNYQLLDDRIYSTVKGYVTGFEIIDDNGGEGGLYKVTVKANVALGALTKDVKALGLVQQKLNYPRIMVLVNDHVDGLKQPGHFATAEIGKVFAQSNVPVVSRDQMQMIKERDATLFYGDPDKAAALGRRYGAEVAIVGQATSELVEASQPYGVEVYAYQATVDVKAVKTDNAQVIAFESATETARGSGRFPTANKAILAASRTAADGLLKRVAEAWRDEVYNEMVIEVIAAGATPVVAEKLRDAVGSLEGVKSVSIRSAVNNVVELSVRFFGSIDQFVSALESIKSPAIKITGRTPNRVDIEVATY